MVVLRAASQEKVYVHTALLGDEIASVGACKWSCFPRDTVKNFVEYLYQGDYTDPPAVSVLMPLAVQARRDMSRSCHAVL